MSVPMKRYIADLRNMAILLSEGDGFITVLTEEEMGGCAMLNTAEKLYPVFQQAWEGDDSGIRKLGWTGGVSQEWRNYLEERNHKLHPEQPPELHRELSCRYLAMLFARVKLHLRGSDPEWQVDYKHLEISFAPPLPHAPRISTRVFYRTLPIQQTKLHIPYWRAKGFFRLTDADTLRGGLMPGSCARPIDFHEGWLSLSQGDTTVRVSADLQR